MGYTVLGSVGACTVHRGLFPSFAAEATRPATVTVTVAVTVNVTVAVTVIMTVTVSACAYVFTYFILDEDMIRKHIYTGAKCI